MIGECLRLEIAPFGVKVVTVVTGEVKTNFFNNTLDYKLPSGSVYMPIEKEIAASARGEGIDSQTKAEDYADQVVGAVLGNTNGKIYRGETSSWVRFISPYLPTFSLVSPTSHNNGLGSTTNEVPGLCNVCR